MEATLVTAPKIDVHKKLPGNACAGWYKCFVVAFFAVILFATSPLQAAPITVPTDLNPGDQYRLAFVTDGTQDAVSADIEVYNTFVTNDANAQRNS